MIQFLSRVFASAFVRKLAYVAAAAVVALGSRYL